MIFNSNISVIFGIYMVAHLRHVEFFIFKKVTVKNFFAKNV